MEAPQTPSGLLLIDKPAGITSFDCIRVLRRNLGIKKIGHAGTLDPMATGLMILLVGKATKSADSFLKKDKSYQAEITLGSTSTTGDKEGELTAVSDKAPSVDEVEAALKQLTGIISQVPPAYSAIKVGGVAAYKRARRGEVVELKSREVEVYKLELVEYKYPVIKVRADVSSGTYIRTLAEDIGKLLETGAYLTALRRTSIGSYSIDQAKPLDEALVEDLIPVG